MADLLDVYILNFNDNVFVYMGGEQVVPDDVTHVIIHHSVKIIPQRAFYGRRRLLWVETHHGITKVEKEAFANCSNLRGMKLPGVREIKDRAFWSCKRLRNVELSEELGTIGEFGFFGCRRLRCIALPLKNTPNLCFDNYVFSGCHDLSTVDLIGGIHKTISYLHLESWKADLRAKIDQINGTLLNYTIKARAIKRWMQIHVIPRMNHYKTEHYALLKEAMTLLELALWKANLDKKKSESLEEVKAKKAKIDAAIVRRGYRITSGAEIVIKNVLPFLLLK